MEEDNPDWQRTEEKFQQAFDAKDDKTMFLCLHRICYATCKKRAAKLSNTAGRTYTDEELLEKSLDATAQAFARMKRLNQRPRKLTSYLGWPIFEAFHSARVRKAEVSTVSLDSLYESGYQPPEESNFEDEILQRIDDERLYQGAKSNMATKLKFNDDMYTTTFGSYLVTQVILGRMAEGEARQSWKKRKHYEGKELKFTDTSNMCIVKSSYNTLVMPYIVDDDGEKRVLPLREDGIYPSTFRNRKEVIFG